jgi:1,2-diacylglycerol-3-alpha-glucose alpha-1,2-galactosyltransferase
VIVEAAAAGMPVLLRDIAQYRITFKDWYTKGQEEDFPGLIKKLATDSKYYAQQVKQALKIAEAYDSKNGAERLLEVYRATLAAN